MKFIRNVYVTIGVLMIMLALSMDLSWYSPAQVELERQAFFIQTVMLVCGLNFVWFGSRIIPMPKKGAQLKEHSEPSIYDVTPYGFIQHESK